MNLIQMFTRCPQARVVAWGNLEDFDLEFRTFANVVPSKGQKVPVVVWEITEGCEERLDRYEGISRGLYKKEQMRIKLTVVAPNVVLLVDNIIENGVEALIYVMNEDKCLEKPPSESYYRLIVQGYLQNGLSDFSPLLQAALKSGITIEDSMYNRIDF